MAKDQNTFDFLIIGQGIAGSVLTLEIFSRGYSFKIINEELHNSASKVAGGISHPMSFRRTIQTWNGPEFLEYAIGFYKKWEEQSSCHFWNDFEMLRIYGSIEEQNTWLSKVDSDELKGIIEDYKKRFQTLNASLGVGKVNLSGKLDALEFLNHVKRKFESYIQSTQFKHRDLQRNDEGEFVYDGQVYRHVIFCEGYKYVQNPFFSYLPHNITKGEVLHIKCDLDELKNKILSKGGFIAPLANKNHFVVGSTYKWKTFEDQPSSEGLEELKDKLAKLGIQDYEIIDHKAGLRPTTHDRKPMIGEHPEYSGMHIFSGMGSKSIMQAPLLAQEYLDELEGKGELMKEASIKRLEKKYFFNPQVNNEREKMPKL